MSRDGSVTGPHHSDRGHHRHKRQDNYNAPLGACPPRGRQVGRVVVDVGCLHQRRACPRRGLHRSQRCTSRPKGTWNRCRRARNCPRRHFVAGYRIREQRRQRVHQCQRRSSRHVRGAVDRRPTGGQGNRRAGDPTRRSGNSQRRRSPGPILGARNSCIPDVRIAGSEQSDCRQSCRRRRRRNRRSRRRA